MLQISEVVEVLPIINYRLRDDLRTIIVCLYNPHDMPETRFTTDNLSNFIRDCEWQLETGEPVRRIPFYVTPSATDAMRACESMQQALQELRKLKPGEQDSIVGSPGDLSTGESVKDNPRGENRNPAEGEVTPTNTAKNKKGNTPYHLYYRNRNK